MRGAVLEADVRAVLDRYLDPNSEAPIALALSGGGDSIALLRLTAAWARSRPVLAVTVDHGLHPDSAAWTAFAAEQARALGCGWRGLDWAGLKPTSGLPAAARTARHALLADAAREVGASVILTGHTADDVLEGEIMRTHDAPTLGRLREWSPSPAWPEGRGVFLLRPLLEVRRAALRAWLRGQGASWLEDPANDDSRFARARARATVDVGGPEFPVLRQAQDEELYCDGALQPRGELSSSPHPEPVEGRGRLLDGSGVISLRRGALSSKLFSAALVCAAGTDRPPRSKPLARLIHRIAVGERFTATLAGARVHAADRRVIITREPGERRRGGLAALVLHPDAPVVWDGRFELTGHAPGLTAVPLAGHAASLSAADRRHVVDLPPAARAALPALRHGAGPVSLPAPFGSGPATARGLVHDRLDAALGAILDERALKARAAPSHGAAEALTLS